MTDLFAAPTPCGSTSLHGGHTCVLHQGHTGLHANKTLAEVTPDGERIVWQILDNADTVTVDCFDVELDNGETLADLGVDNYLELGETVAGMRPGTWLVLAYDEDDEERTMARLRRLTGDELTAARKAIAASLPA